MPVDPARLKDLFTQALTRTDAHDRAAFLDVACAGDLALRARVEALLRASEDPDSQLDAPGPALPLDAAIPTATFDRDPADEPLPVLGAGAIVAGKYKLLQQIGEGGMGSVWMADQTEPVKRRVAVKLIRADRGASKTILSRFEAERQAIALMNHPNIARLLDAGTTDAGTPFFVMELVKGVPLTEFCDAHKLSVVERLNLFRQICSAVHHAHQKGVIHRDLKPTNILVESHDGKPVPKVIDFGLAKATTGLQLTEHTLFTAFGTVAGTPLYMAPEQATFNAIDVDSRADIYALGVILYELLCGTTPLSKESLKSAALDEVLRTIREQEPPPPSSRLSTPETSPTVAANRGSEAAKLGRFVKGELDWIVMKALSKERERRYESAPALAADVERFLNQEPVLAGPPSQWYRLRKFVRRNKARVAAVSAVLLALVAGVAGTSLGLVFAIQATDQARDEERKAIAERERADGETVRARTEEARALAAQDEQQANQYLWDMQTVPLYFQSGNIADVKRLLDRHAPAQGGIDRRAFEWFYWHRQLNSDLRTEQLPASDKTNQGYWAASPDGSRVAVLIPPARGVAGASPVLQVWDTATGRELLRHTLPIQRPAPKPGEQFTSSLVKPLFSPDGRRVAAEWSFSPSRGPRFATGGQRLCQVIDVDTKKVLLSADAGQGSVLGLEDVGSFSRDGRRFASEEFRLLEDFDPFTEPFGPRSQTLLRVWDLDTGKGIGTLLDAKGITEAELHPSGDRFVLLRKHAEENSFHLSVWDVATRQESPGWDVPAVHVSDLTFSPDGERVVAAIASKDRREAGIVKQWELSGKEIATWELPEAHSGANVLRQFFTPDGSKLVVVRSSERSYTATVLDAKSGKPFPAMQNLSFDSAVILLAISPDGQQLAARNGNLLRVWDMTTGRLLHTLRGHVGPVEAFGFGAGGTRLWSIESSGLLKEWDLAAKTPVTVPTPRPAPGWLTDPTFAVSADGERVAVHCPATKDEKETVRVHDRDGKLLKTLVPPVRVSTPDREGELSRLALSREGRRLLLARAEFRRPPTPKAPAPFPGFIYTPVEVEHPDLTLWDTETGVILFHQRLAGSNGLRGGLYLGPAVALSPDGRVCIFPTMPAKPGGPVSLRVFDIDTQQERSPISLPSGINHVVALSLSPDGSRVALAGLNFQTAPNRGTASLLVGRTDGSEPFHVKELHADVPLIRGPFDFQAQIAWHPDGSRFVFSYGVGSSENGLAVYDAATGRVAVTLERPLVHDWSLQRIPHEVAYSPMGKRIAVILTGNNDGNPSLQVWDAKSGKEVLTMPVQVIGGSWRGGGGNRTSAKSLVFRGDGHSLMTWEVRALNPRRPDGPPTAPLDLLRSDWDATPISRPATNPR